MSSQMVAWMLSGIWLLAIMFLWLAARDQARHLKRHEEILKNSFKDKPGQPSENPQEYLEALGWQASSILSRRDMIAHWRAITQTDKQKLATFIEMMPQMGLLGTVISLFLSAFIFDFTMKMLGLALATTGFGLIGSISARQLFEMPAEKHYYSILELLKNDDVVECLLHLSRPVTPPTTDTTPQAETAEREAASEQSNPAGEGGGQDAKVQT